MSADITIYYKLGSHRLARGDCTDASLIKKLVGKDRIKLIVADPPYGVGYVENKAGFSKIKKAKIIANDDLTNEESYKAFTTEWLKVAVPHLYYKNALYIFNSDKMVFALKDAMVACGFNLSQLLIWVKNNQVTGRKDYLLKHELIVYGWYGVHEFLKSKDKSVIFYPKPMASPLHPTSKPVGLIRRLILNSTRIGDIVYDPFGGSGSTLIACEQTRRKCLTAEIDPDYCNTIIERFKRLKRS